jgi:hypothetical protein
MRFNDIYWCLLSATLATGLSLSLSLPLGLATALSLPLLLLLPLLLGLALLLGSSSSLSLTTHLGTGLYYCCGVHLYILTRDFNYGSWTL